MSDVFGGGDVPYEGQSTGVTAMPDFLSNLNPDGTLKSQDTANFQSTMGDENAHLGAIPQLNTDPLHNLENYAQSGSNNPWVQAQMDAQKQAEGQAMGASKANAASANTAAQDAMAARGGINTGAMERANQNAANNATTAGQNVLGQGLQQKGQIQTQNAQNQLGVAENLPGQEVQALQPELQKQSLWQQAAGQNQAQQQQLNEFNLANQQGGLNAQNQFNMSKYQNQLAEQAGREQASAQSKSGKK